MNKKKNRYLKALSISLVSLAMAISQILAQDKPPAPEPPLTIERAYTYVDMGRYAYRKPLDRVVMLTVNRHAVSTEFCGDATITDDEGNSYTGPTGVDGCGTSRAPDGRWQLDYQFQHMPIPKKKVGKITFKTTVRVDDETVPISVILEHHA